MKDRWYCPLMEDEIDGGTCFDILMVIQDGAPKRTAPEKAVTKENFQEICKRCEYYRED